MSDFNFQWTKTLYTNILSHIAFFFTLFKGCTFKIDHFPAAAILNLLDLEVLWDAQGPWARLVICNNLKDNFLREPEKIYFKFHRNCEKQVIFWKCCEIWHFIFSGSHKKFSLVLLQLTKYIHSSWKMQKRMGHCLNYPDTRFLSTEN